MIDPYRLNALGGAVFLWIGDAALFDEV